MFFILSKILYYAIMPAVWLVGIGLWAVFTPRQTTRKKLCYWWLALLFIFTNEFLVNEMLLWWERPATPLTELHGNYDVAVVLTGMANSIAEPKDRVHLTQAADRIMHTVWLYRQGRVRHILISGGSGSLVAHEAEALQLRELLTQTCLVPDSVITLDTLSRNTRENALFSAKILQNKFPNQKYLLVTSAFHMRRSEGCFRKVGVDFTPFSTDIRAVPRRFTPDAWLVPSENALGKWHTIIHEITGYLTYKIVGYC